MDAHKTILDRLRKIKALADQGVDGEATAAQHMLERELAKHNLTLEDLGNATLVEAEMEVGTKDEFTLFYYVVAFVVDDWRPSVRAVRKARGKTIFATVKATKVELADVKEIFAHYKPALREARRSLRQQARTESRGIRSVLRAQRKSLAIAMLNKHRIFPPTAARPDDTSRRQQRQRDQTALWLAMRQLKSGQYVKKGGYLT